MITKQRTFYLLLLFLLTLFHLSGCSSGSSPGKQTADETKSDTKTTSRETYTDVCTPQASQTVMYGDKTTSLDASHTENGYLMLCYNGKVSKVKLQITTPDGTVYTYTLNPDPTEVMRLFHYPEATALIRQTSTKMSPMINMH